MSTSRTTPWQAMLRWLIGVLLIWAALGKLANLQEFLAMLAAYRLPLPAGVLRGTAMVLPWMELLCGLLLLAGARTRAALAWSMVMFVVFIVCTGQAWMRGLEIACGCLDLRFAGVLPGAPAAAFLESVEFAFARAAVLACVTGWLLFKQRGMRHPTEA
jgi:uncharacterized membrane protein YphA (DoxX/SURF4 family)